MQREQVIIETAETVVTRKQKVTFLVVAVATILLFSTKILTIAVSTINILFFLGALYKLFAIAVSRLPAKQGNIMVNSELIAFARQECEKGNALTFTIFPTLFNEGNVEVLSQLIQSIDNLEYDKEFLQVLFVIPRYDTVTEEALENAGIENYPYMSVFRAPETAFGEAQTKPRDLNYALELARGDIICIFDAEDQPHPLQLLAVMGAALKYSDVQAFQCELRYNTVDKNISTRLAAVSYAAYFRYVLPGYVVMNWALPFGGTSNYFRREAIRTIGGWDGHNITEDANLGILFKLFNFPAVMLFGVETIEKPNDAPLFTKVRKQWTRWQAGFLITMLVQIRRPLQMIRLLGPLGTIHVIMLGMTPVFGAFIPVLLLLTLLRFLPSPVIANAIADAMAPTLLLAWFSFIVGNFLFIITFFLGGRTVKLPWYKILQTIFAMYAFSVAVGISALKRVFVNPHFWGKTVH